MEFIKYPYAKRGTKLNYNPYHHCISNHTLTLALKPYIKTTLYIVISYRFNSLIDLKGISMP